MAVAHEESHVQPSPDAARRRAPRRALLLRVLSVLAGLVAACLLLEVAFRLFGVDPTQFTTKRVLERTDVQPWPFYHCYSSNPHDEFRPLPRLDGGAWRLSTITERATILGAERLSETPWCIEYRLSSFGLRDRELDVRPAPGVTRILCVGDSFTFGEGVPAEKTLPVRTAAHLGPGFEVANVSRPGWSTGDEINAVERYLPELHSTRAILVFTANDIELTPKLEARQSYINDLVNLRDENFTSRTSDAWYSGSSRLLRYVGGTLEMRRIAGETIQWYRDLYDPEQNGESLARMESYFRRLAARTDCQTLLVLYPLMEGLEGDYPLADVHARVVEMARAAGLPVLDLAPAFAGQRTSDLWVHDSDHHPNSRAHAIAARAIVDWLRREQPEFLELPSAGEER